MQDYILKNRSPESGTVLVPIVFFSGETGKIVASGLSVRYVLQENRPPVLSLEMPQGPFFEGEMIRVVASAVDPDNDSLVYSVDRTFFGQNGNVFEWVPVEGSQGTYSVVFYANDGDAVVSKEVVFTIEKKPVLPACSIDSDCSDNDDSTRDLCVDAGKTLAYCMHSSGGERGSAKRKP